MKKLKYLLLAFLLSPIATFAQTTSNENSENDILIGVSITQEELDASKNYTEDTILGTNTKTIATTRKYDALGNIVYSQSKELTADEKLLIENNDNVHILENGNLEKIVQNNSRASVYWRYETDSKEITIYYVKYTSGEYGIQLTNSWKINPINHSYDIIAARWTKSKGTSTYTVSGRQTPTVLNPYVEYTESASSNNIVKYNYGAGISQNLYDDYVPMTNYLSITSTNDFGTEIYGTYQHAVRSVTLAQSKAYTISSEGLGGVILHDYPSYYDGMTGVYS